MIVKGVQRPRKQKRSGAERLLFAGFFLALSTQAISHQDAMMRFQAGVGTEDRWRTHVVTQAEHGTDGLERRYASLVGPNRGSWF